MSVLKLTICRALQWIDLGEAIGVDVERATGQVSESDLETQFKPMGDQQKAVYQHLFKIILAAGKLATA